MIVVMVETRKVGPEVLRRHRGPSIVPTRQGTPDWLRHVPLEQQTYVPLSLTEIRVRQEMTEKTHCGFDRYHLSHHMYHAYHFCEYDIHPGFSSNSPGQKNSRCSAPPIDHCVEHFTPR